MDRDISKVIESLRGTCGSLGNVCETLYDIGETELTSRELSRLDEEIFCCTVCGWWHEQPAQDLNGEWVCDECYVDEVNEIG